MGPMLKQLQVDLQALFHSPWVVLFASSTKTVTPTPKTQTLQQQTSPFTVQRQHNTLRKAQVLSPLLAAEADH